LASEDMSAKYDWLSWGRIAMAFLKSRPLLVIAFGLFPIAVGFRALGSYTANRWALPVALILALTAITLCAIIYFIHDLKVSLPIRVLGSGAWLLTACWLILFSEYRIPSWTGVIPLGSVVIWWMAWRGRSDPPWFR
jgi:hypothetical protein